MSNISKYWNFIKNFKLKIKNYFCVTRYTLHATRSGGFTLLELIVSMGILTILVGFSSWAYLAVQKNSNLSNQTSQLVSSVRQAQSLSMAGQTQDGQNRLDMGIHFEADKYIIFYGATYAPADPHNIKTDLLQGISINPNFGTFDLVFAKGTGMIENYNELHHDLTISQIGGQAHLISINKMGIVDFD